MSIIQERMIAGVRELCHADERVLGALMFGSFVTGEGDAFSDIEFVLFIRDEAFEDFDQREWLNSISPVAACFPDDFGHQTALFENGIRGEFHFKRNADLPIIASWQGCAWFPSLDDAVVLDRTGELSPYAAAFVGGPPPREGRALAEGLALNLLNLILFGANLLNRGEFARAWALLSKAHENLLKLVRLEEGVTDHWPTPSRALESDLSAAAYTRYVACTASARPNALCAAYWESWKWSRELFATSVTTLEINLPEAIFEHVERLLEEAMSHCSTR